MTDDLNCPDGTTEYFTTSDDPNLLSEYVWSAADQAWLYKGLVRREDLPSRRVQAAAVTGLRAALHSYVHATARPDVRPYFKLGPTGPGPRAASGGGPWDVPALCQAYQWPTGLAGGGVIAIVELGGGWVQSDMDQFFASIGQPVPQITDVSVDGTRNTPELRAEQRRWRGRARHRGRRRRVLCGDRQAGHDPRLLGAGYRRRGARCDARWLRCMLDLLGCGRSQVGSASGQ